jgi:hypothetical protein
MRISGMLKVTAISAALVASMSLPAAAIETTWADVREGSGGDARVETSILTAAREAPGTFELSPLTSYASERESAPDSEPSYSTLVYVREAPALGDTLVETSILTAAREAPGSFELSPLTSYASEREFSATDSEPSYSTLAYVREAPALGDPSTSAWASVREAVDPSAAVAVSPVQESASDTGDEIIVGSALAAAFLLGAGLGIVISRRRMPSLA